MHFALIQDNSSYVLEVVCILHSHLKDKSEVDEITDHQESNTRSVEIDQESTTPETSAQDKLASTGDVNALIINELNESIDFSNQGSRSSSFAMELAMALIEEERSVKIESEAKIELSQNSKSHSSLRTIIRKGADMQDDFETDDETFDRIEMSQQGHIDDLGNTRHGSDDVMTTLDVDEGKTAEFDGRTSILCDDENNPNEIQNEGFDYDEDQVDYTEHAEKAMANFDQIEELISEEIEFYDNKEKMEREASMKDEIQESLKEENDNSLGEEKERSLKALPPSPSVARARMSVTSTGSGDSHVIDRKNAPKCLFEYEPSTTEADSDLSEDSDDTLETEPLHDHIAEEDVAVVQPETIPGVNKKTDSSNTSSLIIDKEVAKALHEGSSGTNAGKQGSVVLQHDVNRESVEPNTQNTMDDQASLVEEADGDEVNSLLCATMSSFLSHECLILFILHLLYCF